MSLPCAADGRFAARPKHCGDCGAPLVWLNGAFYSVEDVERFGHRCAHCGKLLCDSRWCRYESEAGDEVCFSCYCVEQDTLRGDG